MEKSQILKFYTDLGIHTPFDLYDFIIKNSEAIIDNKTYNLRRNNQTMEFMALYLSSNDYKVIRLYFEKENSKDKQKHSHWFLAFQKENNWFYFEPSLRKENGKYKFNTYDELIYFVADKLNKIFDKDIKKYSIYEITPLKSFRFIDNVKQSKNGVEIFPTEVLILNNPSISKAEEEACKKKALENIPVKEEKTVEKTEIKEEIKEEKVNNENNVQKQVSNIFKKELNIQNDAKYKKKKSLKLFITEAIIIIFVYLIILLVIINN